MVDKRTILDSYLCFDARITEYMQLDEHTYRKNTHCGVPASVKHLEAQNPVPYT